MKLLWITTDYYPTMGTTTNLLKKLFFDGGLHTQAEELAVLTLKRSYDEPDEEVINGVRVYRATAWRFLKKQEIGAALRKNPLDAVSGAIKKARFRGQTAALVHEDTCRSVLRALRSIHAERFDVLVPVFGMFESVAAVMRFAGKTTQRVVLYQVDPCSTNMTYTDRQGELLAFERAMYQRASAVITTPIICQEQKELLPPELYQKLTAMELPLVAEPAARRAEELRANVPVCLFSGLIYAGIRDPRYTLRLFAPLVEADHAQLHLVGVRQEDLPEEFQALPVVCHGRVPLDRAQELMNGADVLVNIGNLMTNQVPSKIFDYVSLGKPIVNICKNRNCPTLPYLEHYPLALNLFEEEALLETQQARLAAFLREYGGRRLPFAQVAARFETCTPRHCADQMSGIFAQGMRGNGGMR